PFFDITEIFRYTLHDALPILDLMIITDSPEHAVRVVIESYHAHLRELGHGGSDAGAETDETTRNGRGGFRAPPKPLPDRVPSPRSEEHTSELQSRENLVCRLL